MWLGVELAVRDSLEYARKSIGLSDIFSSRVIIQNALLIFRNSPSAYLIAECSARPEFHNFFSNNFKFINFKFFSNLYIGSGGRLATLTLISRICVYKFMRKKLRLISHI